MNSKVGFKYLKENEKKLTIADLNKMYSKLSADPRYTIKMLERRKK